MFYQKATEHVQSTQLLRSQDPDSPKREREMVRGPTLKIIRNNSSYELEGLSLYSMIVKKKGGGR